jgi:hypothetical protein
MKRVKNLVDNRADEALVVFFDNRLKSRNKSITFLQRTTIENFELPRYIQSDHATIMKNPEAMVYNRMIGVLPGTLSEVEGEVSCDSFRRRGK